MTATLTDRYVAATLRSVPEAQRPEIERELRASIADAVDGRLESGESEDAAETAVLTELGDPAILAASFADRPLHLIGPALFVDYVRFLRVVLTLVVPLTLVGVAIAQVIVGSSPLEVMGAAISTAFTAAVHIGFWTTAIFALLERTSGRRSFAAWSPSQLPMITDRKAFRNELIGGSIFTVVAAAAVVFSQELSGVVTDSGERVGPIADSLWQSGALYLVIFFAVARIALDLVGYYAGWPRSIAVATAVLGVLFAVPTVWLAATGRLYNPEFFEALGWDGAIGSPGWATTATIVVVVYLSLHDTVEMFIRTRRSAARSKVSK